MIRNGNGKRNKRRVIAIVCAALLAASVSVVMLVMSNIGVSADTPASWTLTEGERAGYAEKAPATVPINSSSDLIAYSREYACGGHNPNDTLSITQGLGSYLELPSTSGGFISLGVDLIHSTENNIVTRPFNGKIEFNGSKVFELDTPLFYCVTTDAKIVTSGGAANTVSLRMYDNGDLSAASRTVFAENVVAGTTNSGTNEWMIETVFNTAIQTPYKTSSLIGTIGAGAKASVTYTNNSKNGGYNANVEDAGNVGLVCGTMGAGSQLTVKINSGLNDSFTITSTGGNAGGIVGEMRDCAKLIFAADYSSAATVTANASAMFAGGLVGKGFDAEIAFGAYTATVAKTVTGGTNGGAGGMYGCYESTKDNAGSAGGTRVFDLEGFASSSGFGISRGKDCGGVIGKLNATNNVTVQETGATFDSTYNRDVRFTGGTYRGGIIGTYKNSSLDNILYIHGINVKISANSGGGNSTVSAGAVGVVSDEADNKVYIKTENLSVNTAAALTAGAVGDMRAYGSFLDMYGTTVVKGTEDVTVSSGLVGKQNAGVIRIQGITDLSGINTSSQLVGTRGNGLVYALGSGNDGDSLAAGNWTFHRPITGADDIGDWGEVLRVDGTKLDESKLFTVDGTHHTVTVAGHVAEMANITDFVKTALNIQLNDQDRGSLKFSSSTRSSTILGASLSITADIDLSETGIVELTRDNGGNSHYSGTFNGNGHKVTLAIGEYYGLDSAGNAKSGYGSGAYGTIFSHKYQGLFAEANGATFTNLTVAGRDSTRLSSGGYVGGLAAFAMGNLTLTNVTTSQTVDVYGATSAIYCGGAVGYIQSVENEAAKTIAVNSSTFGTVMNDARGNNENAYFGGVIGYVRSTSAKTLNIGTAGAVTLSGSYSKTNNSTGNTYYGGLIGAFYPASTAAGSNARKVYIQNVTVSDGVSITTKNKNDAVRGGGSGAFLGSLWPNVDVAIGTEGNENGVTVGNPGGGKPSISVQSGSGNGNIGALFYKATGKMEVHHVNVNDANVTTAESGSTFGFIVNDACYSATVDDVAYSSALYLTVDSAKYSISDSGVTFTASKFDDAFDEIAAYSAFNGADIASNGQAIISIEIPSAVSMDGSNCNTYQNQTGYAKKNNPNTRYYYNLESIRKKVSPSNAEKLLMWSVNKYAHSSVEDLFTNGFTNTVTGNCDMKGLSYYPVDASGMAISDAMVIFYNNEIELGEGGTGNDDDFTRSTHDAVKSQHYLMHEGIFRNYTGTLTVDGLTLHGNVSNKNTGYSGFLVCGTLGNGESVTTAEVGGTVLSGAVVVYSDAYAPLLINKIGKNTNMEMVGVSAVAGTYDTLIGSSGYAASSLIGDVGSDTAKNINLKFSGMVLDSRTSVLSSGTANASLTSAYGTSRTLFTRATFLNSFTYLNGGRAEYNYEYDEDHPGLHQVTYAEEITSSSEFSARTDRDHYYDDTTHFTDPTGACASAYDFSSGFLPHVYNYDGSKMGYTHYHEIRINQSSAELTDGCGQYNHPYVITDGTVLVSAASIISGSPAAGVKVTLPDDLGADMWCAYVLDNTDAVKDRVYTYTAGTFTADDGSGKTKTLEDVRTYLAGAYYSIESSIELDAGFVGLGSFTDAWTDTNYECKYAFRGVIVGNNNTVTNLSSNPLIKSANGCVVKDLTVSVGKDGSAVGIEISETSRKNFSYGSAGCASYGAVFGQVMGGDNIVDKVGVDFTYANFSYSASDYIRLAPVGGYVGVILNGGVIFRNMDLVGADDRAGLTAGKWSLVSDGGWLYVNPIIGRVIAGYAFNEANAYKASSTTLVNGTKNYGICDLDPESGTVLEVTATNKNSHEITINDAQAFYILSCIVNCGAGSANYGNTEQAYTTIANTPWVAYRNYTSTRCAKYDEVGTSATIGGDYDTVKTQDVYSGTTKVPYIVRKYTNKSGSVYRARSICNGNNPSVSQITLSETTYDLPTGYRGIGSIYSNNGRLFFKFNKLTGNDAVINLSMKYQDYNHASGSNGAENGTKNENYIPFNNAGFGLFNQIYNSSSSDTNCIKDITLTGSVFYDFRKLSDGSVPEYSYGWNTYDDTKTFGSVYGPTSYYKDTSDWIKAANYLHVGGLAGANFDALYLDNVKTSSLSVEGAKYAGGLVGYSSAKNITVNKPAATSLTVRAGFCAGGVIGGFYASASLNVTGTENNHAILSISEITVKGKPSCAKYANDNDGFSDMFHCSGGICGFLQTSTNATVNTTDYQAIVEYVEVTGGHFYATHMDQRPHDLRYKVCVGGLFGKVNASNMEVTDCSVHDTQIDGNIIGGAIGYLRYSIVGSFSGFNVDNVIFNSANSAGGVIGYYHSQAAKISNVNYNSVTKLSVSDSTVSNCTLTSTGISFKKTDSDPREKIYSERACVGGIFGGCLFQAWGVGYMYDVSNVTVANCVLSRDNEASTASPDYCGVGGIYGVVPTSTGYATGHNILLYNVSFEKPNYANRQPGMICGTNQNNAQIRLVGVSIKDDTNRDYTVKTVPNVYHVGANGAYGANGYVVFADYNGDCVSSSGVVNTTVSSLNGDADMLDVNAVAKTDYPAADPYVTINTSLEIGDGDFLMTGDGMAETVNDYVAKKIKDGSYAKPYNETSNTTRTNLAAYIDKLSTYNVEQTSEFAKDFVVIVVDDVTRVNTTNMINAFINTLANTKDFDYSKDQSGVFRVVLKRLTYNESTGEFEVSDEDCNLKRYNDPSTDTNQFYMDIEHVDTAGEMFSLIDVQFLDPANTDYVAYHLYLPVVVKKMLTYDFVIATGSGTNYERDWYDKNDRWGQPLMENLGTPASIYFKYTYNRSIEEWLSFIASGENMNRNYDKVLNLELPALNSDQTDYLNGTVLVLVDPQRGGKPYYAFFSDVYDSLTGKLSLSGFREGIGSGAYFEPADFSELLNVTATLDNANGNMKTCSAGEATVVAKLDGVDTYFRVMSDGEGDPKYTLSIAPYVYESDNGDWVINDSPSGPTVTVNGELVHVRAYNGLTDGGKARYSLNVEEKYYISFFTDTPGVSVNSTLFDLTFIGEETFGEDSYPSRIDDPARLNAEGSVHLLLGDIFSQSNFTVKANTVNQEISSSNDTLNIGLGTNVQINPDIKETVSRYLNRTSPIEIYHSFLVKLIWSDGRVSKRIIDGNPAISGTYTLNMFDRGVATTENIGGTPMVICDAAHATAKALLGLEENTYFRPYNEDTDGGSTRYYLTGIGSAEAYDGAGTAMVICDKSQATVKAILENGTVEYFRAYIPADGAISKYVVETDSASATAYLAENINRNNNYAEFITDMDIKRYLVEGDGINVVSDVALHYASDDAISKQFPEKSDELDSEIGVTVSGSSNVAYSKDRTAYSKCIEEMADDTKLYYCKDAGKNAKLYYNVTSDAFGGDYGQLGINALDPEGIVMVSISTVATLDIRDIYGETFPYDLMRLTVKLYCKHDGYASALTIGDYLDDLWLSFSGVDFDDEDYDEDKTGSTYTFIFPREWAERSAGATDLMIPIDFRVVTGSDLESANHYYSNYKVAISAELVRKDGLEYIPFTQSYDENFIVYTNARLLTEFIQ